MMDQTDLFSANYVALRAVLEHFDVLKVNLGAEIGVLMGNTSSYLLKHFPKLTMLCIDPYKAYNEIGDERTQEAMDFYEQVAQQQLSHFGDRAKMLKAESLEVASQMGDGVLDFVFIDASHEYTDVIKDIEAWHNKVRIGGLISGHDYRWPGVKKAVDEYTAKMGLKGFFTGPDADLWLYSKI